MNEAVKARWVKALLSGEYQQGINCLRTKDNRFCCLGVLCDLWAKETGTLWEREEERDRFKIANMNSSLPIEVREWAGLSRAQPAVWSNGEGVFLCGMNDWGKSFRDIAEAIRRGVVR